MTEHRKAVEATGTTPRRSFLLMLGGLGAAAGLRVGTRTEAFAATPDTNPNLVWRLQPTMRRSTRLNDLFMLMFCQ